MSEYNIFAQKTPAEILAMADNGCIGMMDFLDESAVMLHLADEALDDGAELAFARISALCAAMHGVARCGSKKHMKMILAELRAIPLGHYICGEGAQRAIDGLCRQLEAA